MYWACLQSNGEELLQECGCSPPKATLESLHPGMYHDFSAVLQNRERLILASSSCTIRADWLVRRGEWLFMPFLSFGRSTVNKFMILGKQAQPSLGRGHLSIVCQLEDGSM